MHRLLTVLSSVFALLVVPIGDAAAQPAAATVEELQPLLKDGMLITVTDDAGKHATGKLRQISEGRLLLEKRGGGYGAFPLGDIASVRKTDSRANGYWIGFAIGVVPGVIVGSLFNQYCYNEGPSNCPSAIVVLGGLGGLAGGGIGWAIDSAITGGPMLYARTKASRVAIQPIYSPRADVAGASVRFTF